MVALGLLTAGCANYHQSTEDLLTPDRVQFNLNFKDRDGDGSYEVDGFGATVGFDLR